MIENYPKRRTAQFLYFLLYKVNMNLTPDNHFVLLYDILFEQTTCSPVMLVVN